MEIVSYQDAVFHLCASEHTTRWHYDALKLRMLPEDINEVINIYP